MVHAVSPLTAQPGVRGGDRRHCVCARKEQGNDKPAGLSQFPPASFRRCAWLARPGGLSVADSVPRALLFIIGFCLARRVGPERMAECGHHGRAPGDYPLAGVAARILAAGNDFYESGRSVCECAATSLPPRRCPKLKIENGDLLIV